MLLLRVNVVCYCYRLNFVCYCYRVNVVCCCYRLNVVCYCYRVKVVCYCYCLNFVCYCYCCNGAVWSKDKTQAAESIKWRPQQAYGSNQFLLVQPQTVFSTHTKSSRSRIDKRTARATGNTRYRYSKIAPLDHKMADNCVSLARTNTLSSTITKPVKT